jgi:hypothetical protein
MPLLAFVFIFTLHVQDPHPRADCRDWHECRQLALDAAAGGEYERFHDFAWRAVQTGPKNDPALMYLLARAQSLSGRPGDALVMLQRLAAIGVATDASTNDDFRRVRNLPGWAEFEKTSAGLPSTELGAKSSTTEPAGLPSTGLGAKRSSTDTAGLPSTGLGAGKTSATDNTKEPAEAVRFETLPFTPAGLAYDGVSRRFIVADRRARRLAVIDEFSRHVANLASAQSAGFGDIAAIEIDVRQGDLWVVSADGPRATLHKLQLISGRSLASYVPPEAVGDVEFVDVAATPDDGVLVLDRAGHRVFHLRPKASALELSCTLPDDRPEALAPAGDQIVYVAHASGISRVDLSARNVAALRPGKGVDLRHITKLRWYKGALMAVQRADDGSYRVVRLELDRQGRAVAAVRPLGASLASVDPTAVTLAGGALYYLASADETQMTVRKVLLK